MRTAFFGLHVAASGLHTARKNLNVTSHNIANAEIPGFSRQVAQMQAGRPLMGTGRGMYGTGSQVTGVIQIRDRFLDRKFWNQSAIHGQFTAVHQHLGFVETVFNQIPNVGIKRTFNGFFSTMQDLTTRAHEPTFRTNVATNAHSLAEQVRQNAAALQRQQSDLNREFADVVTTINSLGAQIADLNRQIQIFERDGSNANDLRDQRALLVDRLSTLVNVQAEERDISRPGMANDRRFSVMINGYDFVDHERFNRLELVARNDLHDPRSGGFRNEMDVPGLYDVFFVATGSRFNIHSQTLSGKLRGIVDVRDGNGGQPTASPILTGQQLVQSQFNALIRSHDFLGNLGDILSDLLDPIDPTSTSIAGHVTARNNALDEINDILAGLPTSSTLPPLPITTTAQANAWNAHLSRRQSERDNITNTLLPGLHAQLQASMGLTAAFNAIRALAPAATYPVVASAIGAIETHFTNGVSVFPSVAGFVTTLDGLIVDLQNAIDGTPANTTAISQSLVNARNAIGTPAIDAIFASITTALDRYEYIYTNYSELDDLVADMADYLDDLNNATSGISELTSLGPRIELQLEWAIGNARQMQGLLEERIRAIEAGHQTGDATEYEPLLELLRGDGTDPGLIEQMQNMLNDIILPPTEGVYSDVGVLTTLANALESAISSSAPAVGGFQEIIDEIRGYFIALPNEEPILPFHGATSNFKGIPFYMNQLNHLVRTFARAMNEGRNADGGEIPGAIGHIFGFDANGQNRQAMFFTFEGDFGQPAVVADENDPFAGLRMWILANADGTPQRDANGQFVTVSDPNPPVDADGVSLVARDEMGRPMFTLDYSQMNALNFIVNPELLQDPALLAASSNQNLGQANNDVVHGFLAVANDVSLFREGRLIDFIIATSNHLAVDGNQARMFRESYEEITMQTHNHRLSVKSVDTEEEMLNLVRFQNMFIATSRLINVLDTVYDTLINRLGNF